MAIVTDAAGELPRAGRGSAAADYNPHSSTTATMYALLKTIDQPSALRALERRQLKQLADELRAYVLESVSQTGGHLSSNLGTVELTIALHYVFETPADRIVWDVGHQTYPHKILTGRREAMKTLRQLDGIAGFPRRTNRFTTLSARRIPARRSRRHSAWRSVPGRAASSAHGDYRRWRHDGGDGVRGDQQRRRDGRQSAGDTERQRYVDFTQCRRAQLTTLPSSCRGVSMRRSQSAGKRCCQWRRRYCELAKRAEEHMKGMVTPGPCSRNSVSTISARSMDTIWMR